MRNPLRRPQSTKVMRKTSASQPGNNAKRNPQGNPRELHQKYLILAKEAVTAGNFIEAEQFFQYAEHYYRLVMEHTHIPAH